MVEWKKLGEVCEIVRGASPRPIQNYITSVDGVNWIKIGDVSPNDKYITRTNEKITKEGAKKSRYLHAGDFILSNSMSFGRPYILKIDGCIHDGWIAMSNYEKSMISDYLYEILNSNFVQDYWKQKANNGGAMSNLNSDIVKSTLIPLPSLSEQERIVGILDTFTSSIENLKAQISLRRKQYEHYRDKLLDLEGKPGVEMKTLGEVCDNLDYKRKPITSSKRVAGVYPYYGASGIVDYVEGYLFDGEYLLVSEDGANLIARTSPIAFSIKGKNWVNNHAHVLKFNNRYTQKFVEIYLNMIDLSPWINGAAQPKLNQANLNVIPIPLPSLEEQSRIVSILDEFEASIKNLEAQLQAREKQYEYYREKLLTFERE